MSCSDLGDTRPCNALAFPKKRNKIIQSSSAFHILRVVYPPELYMIPESEFKSKPGLFESELETESESHDAGIGIRIEIKFFGKHWNQNQP